MPDGWPSSVPIYPGSTVVSSFSNADGMMVSLQTKDSITEVTDFYRSKMSAFEKTAEMDLGATKMFSFKRGTEGVTVGIGTKRKEQSDCGIQLTYSMKK